MQMDDWYVKTNVINRKIYANINTIGAINNNTFLYWRAYTLEFDDGVILEYTENFISKICMRR